LCMFFPFIMYDSQTSRRVEIVKLTVKPRSGQTVTDSVCFG